MTTEQSIHIDKNTSGPPAVVTELLAKEFDNFAVVQFRVQQNEDFWNQSWFFGSRDQAQVFLDSLRSSLDKVEWQDHTRSCTADMAESVNAL